MIVRFRKVDKTGAAISCHREDGSITWHRPRAANSTFFAIHDLTHFAVESELQEMKGFFSLIAEGWEFGDFEKAKKTEKPIPDDAGLIEMLVGQLDMERASHTEWKPMQFNEYFRLQGLSRIPERVFTIDHDQLDRIRKHRDELIERWNGVAEHETLELVFDQGDH